MTEEEIKDDDEAEQDIIIAKAIRKARDAFDKVIDKAGMDPSYWSLDLIVSWIGDDSIIMRVQKDIDYQRKPLKEAENG